MSISLPLCCIALAWIYSRCVYPLSAWLNVKGVKCDKHQGYV